jgi:hypothetical protein
MRPDPTSVDHLLPSNDQGPYIALPPQTDLVASFKFASTFLAETGWELHEPNQPRGPYSLQLTIGESAGKPGTKARHYVISLSSPTAQLIKEIWINSIRDARFGPQYLVPDITSFAFEVIDPAYGRIGGHTTLAEGAKPPGLMVQAGTAILDYAETKSRDEGALRTRLNSVKDRLAEYYKQK